METTNNTPTPTIYHTFLSHDSYLNIEGELVQITGTHSSYDFDTEVCTHTASLANGKTIDVDEHTYCYHSVQNFIDQISDFLLKETTKQELLHSLPYPKVNHNEHLCYLIEQDGKPAYFDLEERIHTLKRNNGVNDLNDILFLPQSHEVFRNMKDFCQWNDIKTINKDGEEVYKSHIKALMLTPEQQAIHNKVVAALKEAREAGIAYINDCYDYDGVYAYNRNAYERIDSEGSEEEDEVEVFVTSTHRHNPNYISLFCNAWEDHRFIIKK